MFRSLAQKPLWVHILIAFGIVALLLVIFVNSLDFLTEHDKILKIPSVAGRSLVNAEKQLRDQGFDVMIQDSVYVDTIPPLTVLKQFPEADASVKTNRTVYLTINRSVPPTIEMPNLGSSFRSGQVILKQFGLKLGDTTYKPDFAKNSILGTYYKGEEIKQGTKIPMGSTIDLVLGSGLSMIDMSVPDLFGMTFEQAKYRLDSTGLTFGAIVADPDVRDNNAAFIYKQSPQRYTDDHRMNRIRQGQLIDVWLSTQKPERPDTPAEPQADQEPQN